MSKMNNLALEEQMFAIEEYCFEHGIKEGDLMRDEWGTYHMAFSESEGIYGPMRKVYLPKHLQV